jgi:hypothetical protein
MATLKTTIRTPATVRTIVRATGRPGDQGIQGIPGELLPIAANSLLGNDTGATAVPAAIPFGDVPALIGVPTNAQLTTALSTKVDTTDSSLSDARTPLPHTHPTSEIPGLDALLGNLRPVVLTQPTAVSGNVGDSLSINCLGGILPNTHLNLTYQWQLSTDAGVSYNDITGATSPSIPFNPALVGNNGLYRCRLTNAFGSEDTNAVALTIGVSIANLFGPNDRGLAWDLDNIASLWQNSAGTTPVTAYGDPVGKVDDASGKGNHLIQATSSRRPTYARRPKSGIRNLLQRTEQFDNAYWIKNNSSVSANVETAPDGLATADSLVENTANTGHGVQLNLNTSPGLVTTTVYAKAGTRNHIAIHCSGSAARATASFNLVTGVVRATRVTGTFSAPVASMESVGNGWWRCRFSFAHGVNLTNAFILLDDGVTALSDNGVVYLGNGSGNIFIWGAQQEVSATPSNYQRVTNQFDVTEAGQPDVNYLWFDGIDDCMQSATAINFSNSDEMTVCLAARTLVAAQQVLVESNLAAATGLFALNVWWNNGRPSYRAWGTNLVSVEGDVVPLNTTNVLTGQSKISTDNVTLRRNGTQVALSSADLGSGNLSNHLVNLGSRGQSSLYLNGHLHSGFVINKIIDPAILSDYEKYWVGVKAGIDL